MATAPELAEAPEAAADVAPSPRQPGSAEGGPAPRLQHLRSRGLILQFNLKGSRVVV